MIDYNPLAMEYAQHRRTNTKVVEALITFGKINPTSQVLEVGCGTGNYISALENETGCFCWGCDPSSQMLSEAGRQSNSLALRQGCGEYLEYPDGKFNLVYSVDVIHHMVHPFNYFREAYRVLQPSGMVCTVTESEQSIRDRRPFSNYFPDTVSVDIARYPSIDSLKDMMSSAGFRSIGDETIHQEYERKDIKDFRDKAYSCLHLIPEEAFKEGILRMENDLRYGPIPFISNYLLLWGTKPD